ncbi:nucleolar complex protein 2 [Kipferlia bialata]|uniref:Nucleolar complex protein 2 n=1 Tax=Kipferlia bialata TaxID=797122 RepID=A0A9K3CNF8_9EUKA|nr:nucleolar complex protein 2 [Kipferlia bialata]|eukprot:g1140.t1
MRHSEDSESSSSDSEQSEHPEQRDEEFSEDSDDDVSDDSSSEGEMDEEGMFEVSDEDMFADNVAYMSSEQYSELESQIEAQPSWKRVRTFVDLLVAYGRLGSAGAEGQKKKGGVRVMADSEVLMQTPATAVRLLAPALIRLAKGGESATGGEEEGAVPMNQYASYARTRPLVKASVNAITEMSSVYVSADMLCTLFNILASLAPLLVHIEMCADKALHLAKEHLVNVDPQVRLFAYVCIRAMATAAGASDQVVDECCKTVYMGFMSVCVKRTVHSLPMVAFIRSCTVDLYMAVPEYGLRHAFAYIRELGVFLRTTLKGGVGALGGKRMRVKKEKAASLTGVLSWRFMSALRLWAALVIKSSQAGSQDFDGIIYALVETMLCAFRAVPQAVRFAPARLHIMSALAGIQSATEMHIPVVAGCIEVLQNAAYPPNVANLKRIQQKGVTQKNGLLDLSLVLVVSPSVAHSVAYRETLLLDTLAIMLTSMRVTARTAAFPEFVTLPIHQIKEVRRMAVKSKPYAGGSRPSKYPAILRPFGKDVAAWCDKCVRL